MADVHAIFGTLLALGIAFPGMLVAFWLLFPDLTERTEQRIKDNPVKSFLLGLLSGIALAVPITILLALPFGPAKFLGGTGLLLALAFAGLGAAGVAAAMAAVLTARSNDQLTQSGAFVRGAIALELAAAFPIIGWFLVLPVVLTMSLGASVLAVIGANQPAAETAGAEAIGELINEPQSA